MRYTEEMLLDGLRAYAHERGDQPSLNTWRDQHLRPTTSTYIRRFGSWANALVAAGLEGIAPGGYGHSDHLIPETEAAILRRDAGESLARIGRDMGVSGQALGRRIARHERRGR